MRFKFTSLASVLPVLLASVIAAQDIDPCRYIRENPQQITSETPKKDTIAKLSKWGFREIELKPDFNLNFSAQGAKTCKVQINTLNRIAWSMAGKKTSLDLLAEQRLGGVVYPDTLRNLSTDELRVQLSASKKASKPMRLSPNMQAELKTALFNLSKLSKIPGKNTTPRAFLLPGLAILSAGVKSEKPGAGSMEWGIAGLKIDWLRRNAVDSVLLNTFPNLNAPLYRTINGGMHLTAQWNCVLGKYVKLEHSSRLFKPLFPNVQKTDIELRNTLVINHGHGLQTSIRQSYALSQSLGTPADFSGEVVMGYVFLKQAGKK